MGRNKPYENIHELKWKKEKWKIRKMCVNSGNQHFKISFLFSFLMHDMYGEEIHFD